MRTHRRRHTIEIHAFEPASRSNGPGLRAVIWVQGCSLGCLGCFNPASHAFGGGECVPTAAILKRVISLQDRIEGLTISGGEPLQQPEAIIELLEALRMRTELSSIVFSGFTWEEISRKAWATRLAACADVVIAGRYDQRWHIASGLRGSTNKRIQLLTNRYTRDQIERTPETEAIVGTDGSIVLTGVQPLFAYGMRTW